jgi:chromosome segregation ATPase
VDLDRTDKLPILQGVFIDEDVEDDAVRIDYGAAPAASPVIVSPTPAPELARPSSLDLPSLAESVRSVEERIARQNADYEALNRLYEKARDAQLAAGTRADTLAIELSGVQSALAVEQHRSREMERKLAEAAAATEATRARVEDALRESERYQSESRTLRDSLVAREAAIVQALHSLGERDEQLSALQREHAKVVPALEARSQAGLQLEADLRAERSRAEKLAQELEVGRQSVAELTTRLARVESELAVNRRDLAAAKLQAVSYLETLRSREWRSGFNQNLYREWDAKMDAAQSGQGALQAECDRLNLTAAAMSRKLAEQDAVIAKLQAAAAAEADALAKRARDLEERQRDRDELHTRIESLQADHKRMDAELAARVQELTDARKRATAAEQHAAELVAAADQRHAETLTQIDQLKSEAATHEEEVTVLMAHLNEARRPVQSIQGDIKRLQDELALKSLSIDQLNEENRGLRTTLERTRGALEERELLIRRLERNASNNANVLGRLQTSIERLGVATASGTAPAASSAAAPDFVAQLVRLDGELTVYPLGRRTRIGRATSSELHIDSQSVSRNHAVILKGTREIIIEDLNSTNGVLVNGRKVSRQVLSDGDQLTIGEIHFRCVVKPNQRPAEPAEAAPAPIAPAPIAAAHAGPRPVEPVKAQETSSTWSTGEFEAPSATPS